MTLIRDARDFERLLTERGGQKKKDPEAKETGQASGQEAERDRQTGSLQARKKAMNLLLYKDRSEQELRGRLKEADFEESLIEDAISYVRSFGYLDDRRYAENYVMGAGGGKSRSFIRRYLRDRGIREDYIDLALEQLPADRTEDLVALVRKKAGKAHRLDEKESRRCFAYLARRGFSSGEIWRALHAYQDGEEEW